MRAPGVFVRPQLSGLVEPGQEVPPAADHAAPGVRRPGRRRPAGIEDVAGRLRCGPGAAVGLGPLGHRPAAPRRILAGMGHGRSAGGDPGAAPG